LVDLLEYRDLDYRTFRAITAAIDRLEGKKPSDHPSPEFLLDRLTDEKTAPALLQVALREIDPGFKKLEIEHLTRLLAHEDEAVRLEAIRTLAKHSDMSRYNQLLEIAKNETHPIEHRAMAVAGLADGPPNTVDSLIKLARNGPPELSHEALRSLIGATFTGKQKLNLLGQDRPSLIVSRAIKGSLSQLRPDVQDLAAWKKLLEGEGDPIIGERIFFGQKVGTCSKCHQIDGRGTAVGPDLTLIARRLDQQEDKDEWLLKTILRPSEDMAPQYTPWTIVTKQGKTLTGLPRRKGGNSEAYLGIDGKEFSVKKQDIEFHKESDTSIMPKDLLQNLTDQEIRDLFAFLKQTR